MLLEKTESDTLADILSVKSLCRVLSCSHMLLLKSVEFDNDVALLLSVAGLVMGPRVTSECEIGGTDSTAVRTSWTCFRLCGTCVTGCTSFFRGSDPAI